MRTIDGRPTEMPLQDPIQVVGRLFKRLRQGRLLSGQRLGSACVSRAGERVLAVTNFS